MIDSRNLNGHLEYAPRWRALYGPRPAATRRLPDEGGLEGRLLRCHDTGGSPPSPAVPVRGPTLRVPVLPFGLVPAPRVFTKVLKLVVATLRQMGIRLVIYIDDVLIMAESEDISKAHTQMEDGFGSSPSSRFLSQLGEASANAVQSTGIFWHPRRFQEDAVHLTRGEGTRH